MKEKDRAANNGVQNVLVQAQSELTSQSHSSKLELGRYTMEESGKQELAPGQPSNEPNEVKVARAVWDRVLPIDNLPLDLRKVREESIQKGIAPMAGGSDEEPDYDQTIDEENIGRFNQEQQEILKGIRAGFRGDDMSIGLMARRLGLTPDELMAFRREKIEEAPDIYTYDVQGLMNLLKSKTESSSHPMAKALIEEKNPEQLTTEKILDEIDKTLDELPKKDRRKLLSAFKQINDLPEEEKHERYKEFLQSLTREISSTNAKAKRIIEKYEEDREGEIIEPLSPEEIRGIQENTEETVANITSSLTEAISHLGNTLEGDQQVLAYLIGNSDLNALMTIIAKRDIEQIKRQKEYITSIINDSTIDPDEKKNRLKETIRVLGQNYLSAAAPSEKDPYNPVRSIQELGKYIASGHGADLWGEDGLHPIIDTEKKFHPENMILWVREQTNKMHTDNRNDPISPLGSIHVRIGIGDVSLYDMVRINRQRYMRDEDTGAVLDKLAEELITEAFGFGQVRNYDLAYYQNMREDQKLPDVIGQIHARNDVTNGGTLRGLLEMADVFGQDARVGRAVIFANDIYYHLSDWEELAVILGGEAAYDFPQKLKALKAEELSVDEYIKRVQELTEGLTFTKEDFTDAIRIIQGKKDWENIDTYEGFYDLNNPSRFFCTEIVSESGERKEHDLFDDQGRFNLINFVKYMNVYNYPNPEQSMVNLVKELVRLKAAHKFGLGVGIERTQAGKDAKKARWEQLIEQQKSIGRTSEQAENEANRQIVDIQRHAERINVEFADHLAYAFQRPYGGAAGNDTYRKGYNAASKLNLEDYIIRQSEESRAGPVGVREAVGIYRNVGPDMWTALRTESRETPLEIFKQVRNLENTPFLVLEKQFRDEGRLPENFESKSDEYQRREIEKLREEEVKKIVEKLRFSEGAEADVAGNIQIRGFQIFRAQTGGERLDLDKAVTYDPYQGVKINIAYTEEHVNDGIIKPARYLGSTNGGMKFSSGKRRLDTVKSMEMGFPVYENVTLAEYSYGPELLREFVEYKGGVIAGQPIPIKDDGTVDFSNLTKDQKDYLDYGPGRMEMAKIGMALDFGALLAHHRTFRGPAQRWGYVRNEAFFAMLEAMEEIEPDPNNPGRTRIARYENGKPKRFFNEKLMELMRIRGNVKPWRLFLEDIGLETGGPFVISIIEMLFKLAQEAVK